MTKSLAISGVSPTKEPFFITLLKKHLLERAPVSDLCDRYGLHPTVFYRWQKEFFEKGASAFS
jgi:transposase-like protein